MCSGAGGCWQERAEAAELTVQELQRTIISMKEEFKQGLGETTRELADTSQEVAKASLLASMQRMGVLVNERGCMIMQGSANASGYARVRNQAARPDGTVAKDQAGHRMSVRAFLEDHDFENMIHKGYHASHLCHMRMCVWHVISETASNNLKRNHCNANGSCICDLEPPCALGKNDEAVIKTFEKLVGWGITPILPAELATALESQLPASRTAPHSPVVLAGTSNPSKRRPRVCQYCLVDECRGVGGFQRCARWTEHQKDGKNFDPLGRIRNVKGKDTNGSMEVSVARTVKKAKLDPKQTLLPF